MIFGCSFSQAQLDALVVPEGAQGGVDLLGLHRRDEVEADVDLLDRRRVDAGACEDRLQVGRLVGDARGADGLALQLRRVVDRVLADRHDRGQRLLHERADGHELQALVAREQQLGLVGDREVDLAGRQQLERRGGIARRLDLDVEPGAAEGAVGLGRVDPRVVGVGEVVEHEPQALLGRRGGGLLALAAGGEQQRGEGEQDERQTAGQRSGPSGRRRAQGTRRRSARARALKRSTAKAASRTTAA